MVVRSRIRRQPTNHGMWQTSTYNSWANAKRRCYNPNNPRFAQYGGRGIQVCERWNTFEQFLLDMGEKPTPKHSLDRIDVDGNYCPENCRWATNVEQCNNMSTNVYVIFEGQRKSIADWARQLGITYGKLQHRIKRGWSVRDALTKHLSR